MRYTFVTCFLSYLLLFCFNHSYCQKEDVNWVFGKNAWIFFDAAGNENFITGSQMDADFEGCSSVSDRFGNLMYYSDGKSVWGVDGGVHSVIPNGTGLLGHASSTYSAIFIQHPTNDSILYLFTVDYYLGGNGVRTSTIRVYDGPNGSVVNTASTGLETNKNQLIRSTVSEKIAAFRKPCHDTTWVVIHDFATNQYLAYAIDQDGIHTSPVASNSMATHTNHGKLGEMNFNTDGTKMAAVYFMSDNTTGKIEYLNFDYATGQFTTNYVHTAIQPRIYGVEFSPSSQYLYYSGLAGTPNYLMQIELSTGNEQVIYTNYTGEELSSIKLGPNGKMYVSVNGQAPYIGSALSVIENPDVPGVGCNYMHKVLTLPAGMNNRRGLPATVEYSPSILPKYQNDTTICFGDKVILDPQLPGLQYDWSTGETTQSIEVSQEGVYWVNLFHSTGCVGTDTVRVSMADSVIDLGGPYSLCEQPNVTLTIPAGYNNILWNTGSSSQSITLNTPGNYQVSADNDLGCFTFGVTEITKDTLYPVINGEDSVCPDLTSELALSSSFYSQTWSTGISDPTLTAQPGQWYWVEVEDIMGCTGIDSFYVAEYLVKPVEITGPLEFCENRPEILTATNGFHSYQWNTGSVSSLTETEGGWNVVEAIDFHHCKMIDSLWVIEHSSPSQFLTGPTVVCPNDSVLVQSDPSLNVQWQSGGTQLDKWVKEGQHIVFAENQSGCLGADTLVVNLSPPVDTTLFYDSVFCSGGRAFVENPNKALTVRWLNSSYVYPAEKLNEFEISVEGEYMYEVSNVYGCLDTGQIHIEMNLCMDSCSIHVPNAFTPNGDGLNDVLSPVLKDASKLPGEELNYAYYPEFLPTCDLIEYDFRVFNRWGDEMFHSEIPGESWSGNYKGKACSNEVFTWKLKYKFKDEALQTEVGHVVLLK